MSSRFRPLAAIAAAFLATVFATMATAQATEPLGPTPSLSAAPSAAGSMAVAPLPAIAGRSDYTLGAGDKIRVIVFGEPTLSGEFIVAGSGVVSFPLIGDIPAAKLTVQSFQQEIQTGLSKGYLKEPRVSVEVLTYRPYYILGEVNKPGEYPYSNGLNVLNAVATAGGFTYRAQTKRVFIRRVNETAEKPYPLRSDVSVAPGDTIRISERLF